MSRRIADLLIKIGADSYEFQQKSQQVEKGLENLTKRLDKVGKEMSLKVTAPLTALGVASLAVTSKFDEAMREVSTLSDGISQNFKGFNNEIVTLTKRIPIGATDAAKALYQIVSAGHDGANGMKVLEVSAKAAVAGVTDTATAADAITTLLNAYGLSAENADQLSDQLFTTVRLGKTTFGELGSNISTVAATAASFGIKTEEVLAAVATLTKMGVPTGQAMTQIRSAIVATADVLGDGAFKGRTFQEAMAKMASNAGGSFTALKKDAGRIEAVNAILALTGKNATMAAADLEQLRNSTGATDAAYDKMADSFSNKLKLFKNNVSAIMIKIGNALIPIAETVMNAINKVITALGNMNEPTRKVVLVVGIAAAAIGPLALGLGSLLKFLPLLKSGMALLVAPIGMVRTAIQSLSLAIATNPIGLLLTALSAGVGLFLAFGTGAKDAAEANGDLTNKIIDESKQVNLLIAKLSSANTSEQERKTALEELRKIQPAIVEGLTAEKVELETLTKRASEYNQQLVLRIALARKQDQVAAAIERQTEAGIKQAEKEAALYKTLTDIQSEVLTGKIEIGQYNSAQGITRWREVTQAERKKIIAEYTAIMASGDELTAKAQKIHQMFAGRSPVSMKGMRGPDMKELRSIVGDISQLERTVNSAAAEVQKAEEDVRNFADAFSISLNTAVEQTTATTDDLATSTAGVGGKVEEVKGKIAQLNDQISKLEKQKQGAFSIEEIARCNTEIEKLKKEVCDLNSITLEQLNRQPLAPVLSGDLANLKPIMPKLEIKLPDLLPIVNKAAEQMKQVRESVREGIFGWAGEISSELQTSIMETEQVVSTYTEALVAKGWKFTEALDFVSQKVSEVMRGFDESLNKFLAGSVEATAEAIGQMLAGDLGFDGLMKAILLQLAGFLKSIGSQLIQFGVMIIAFKTALKSVLANPWAAIAVGAAMVAAAAIMTALINKNAQKNAPKLAKGGIAYGPTYAMVGDNPNASIDPEVIAPLSKLKSMMTGGGTQNIAITLGGQLTAKGRDLVYVLGKENFKIDVLGG